MYIVLDKEDIKRAREVAHERRSQSIQKHLKHQFFGNLKSPDFIGAVGELAFAKFLGVPYEGTVNTYKAPDVAGYQVRSTMCLHGSLVVRENDKDDEKYVLVTIKKKDETYECKIAGWCFGHEAKKEKFLRNPNNQGKSWFVPQEFLKQL